MAYRDNSGLDIWFKDEILQTLKAVDMANLDVAGEIDSLEMRLYRRGFEAAIRSMAAAFGLDYEPATSKHRRPSHVIDGVPRQAP